MMMMIIIIIVYKNIMIFLTPLNNYLRNKNHDRSLGGEGGRELILYFVQIKCKYREKHILLYMYVHTSLLNLRQVMKYLQKKV